MARDFKAPPTIVPVVKLRVSVRVTTSWAGTNQDVVLSYFPLSTPELSGSSLDFFCFNRFCIGSYELDLFLRLQGAYIVQRVLRLVTCILWLLLLPHLLCHVTSHRSHLILVVRVPWGSVSSYSNQTLTTVWISISFLITCIFPWLNYNADTAVTAWKALSVIWAFAGLDIDWMLSSSCWLCLS